METYNMEDVKERKWTHATVCCGRRVGGDSTRYNHFMTFFRVEGGAMGHKPRWWCPEWNSSLAVQLVRARGGIKRKRGAIGLVT